MAAIGQPPCPRRHQHPGHAHQPERTHRAVRLVGAGVQRQQHQRRPECAKTANITSAMAAAHLQDLFGCR